MGIAPFVQQYGNQKKASDISDAFSISRDLL